MSLIIKSELRNVAKEICRELRKKQTKAESLLWNELRNRKFVNRKFYRQYPLFFDYLGKETFYIADFYCYEENFVIEVDGKYHDYQKEKDKLRDHVINMLGNRVLRIKNEVVETDIQKVLEQIKNELIPCPSLGKRRDSTLPAFT